MENIIAPVEKHLLEKELTEEKFVRKTNNGNNKIYIFTHHDSPNLMKELGRVRELTFRDAGGGTGKCCDIDEYDLGDHPFKQLIVWSPVEKEIVGGYRYIQGKNTARKSDGQPFSPTSKLFWFSEKFLTEYWDHTIELGRSFVQPSYQPTVNLRKGMYSLDNLWDGLGAIIIDNPDVQYFFGKITMYLNYDQYSRDLIIFFLLKYFPDPDHLVKPYRMMELGTDPGQLAAVLNGSNYEENYRILLQQVRSRNESIPPLVNAYMNLSRTMKTFGTSLNPEFGEVEEIGIIVTIGDIYDNKKDRHLATYRK